MDLRRDATAFDGWRYAISDWRVERAQLRHHIDELHKTIDRLHALRPHYETLLTDAQKNIRDFHMLEREMDESQSQALPPELDAHSSPLEEQHGKSLPR